MLSTTWKINEEEEYKLRLTASACCDLESRLGANPISVFQSISEDNLPKLEDMLKIIHCSAVPLNHGVKFQDILAAYDRFVDEGHGFADLVPIIINIFKVSGFISSEEDNGKN